MATFPFAHLLSQSEDEAAAWYQSAVMIQDQLETLPASVGGKLRPRLAARGGAADRLPRIPRRLRSARA